MADCQEGLMSLDLISLLLNNNRILKFNIRKIEVTSLRTGRFNCWKRETNQYSEGAYNYNIEKTMPKLAIFDFPHH